MTHTEDTQTDDDPLPSNRFKKWLSFFKKTEPPDTIQNDMNTASLGLYLPHLSKIRLSDIIIPKADIVSVPIDISLDDFLDTVRKNGYSRMPIFAENLDEPLGQIHIKDIFLAHGVNFDSQKFSLEPFVRPIIYAPPSMRVTSLLQRMQSEHIHMALCIDEYGGVEGLITIEDILEEIVGDITDEHDDQDESLFQQVSSDLYIAQARTLIKDFEEETGLHFPKPDTDEEIETLGGLVMALAARVPSKGEIIKDAQGHEFEILDADPRRIKRIKIHFSPNGNTL